MSLSKGRKTIKVLFYGKLVYWVYFCWASTHTYKCWRPDIYGNQQSACKKKTKTLSSWWCVRSRPRRTRPVRLSSAVGKFSPKEETNRCGLQIQTEINTRRVSARLRLLVELVLLLVLLDDGLVGLLEVLGENDVPVLTHGQHAGLRRRRERRPKWARSLFWRALNNWRFSSPPGRWSWCRLQRSYRVGRHLNHG